MESNPYQSPVEQALINVENLDPMDLRARFRKEEMTVLAVPRPRQARCRMLRLRVAANKVRASCQMQLQAWRVHGYPVLSLFRV